MMSPNIKLHKIFYDDQSRESIHPPFLPLNNTHGPSGWFELYPILCYLENHQLDESCWYGFFSPKFPQKAQLDLKTVFDLIENNPSAEVALFSPNWVGIVWDRNVWVSGEKHHPGMIAAAQAFFDQIGHTEDLHQEIGDLTNSVYCNYIIAKPRFWQDWAKLARAYFDYVEKSPAASADKHATAHPGPSSYKLKTFVQERLACWLLSRKKYSVVIPKYSRQCIPSPQDYNSSIKTCLNIADQFKRLARREFPGAMTGYRMACHVGSKLVSRQRSKEMATDANSDF